MNREERVTNLLGHSVEAAFSEEMTFDLGLKEWENFSLWRTGMEVEDIADRGNSIWHECMKDWWLCRLANHVIGVEDRACGEPSERRK